METNFKVDAPSFALGYSAGRKKGGGGAELNIAYGDTPPEDTTKLWVKTSEPSGVIFSSAETAIPDQGVTIENVRPVGLKDSSSVRVGTKIYIFGGAETVISDKIYRFDIETHDFEELPAKLPKATAKSRSVLIGKNIYVFSGGYSTNTSREIYCFDTDSETLREVNLDAHIYGGCGVEAIGATIYLLGGYLPGESSSTNAICKLNTETMEFTTLPDTLPKGIIPNSSTAVWDKKIFTFGGVTPTMVNTIYCFDTVSQVASTKKAKLTQSSDSAKPWAVGDYIYVFLFMKILRYDPRADVMETLSTQMPATSANSGNAVGDGNCCYFVDAAVDNRNVYRYDLALPAVQNGTLHIIPSSAINHFNIIDGVAKVQIGVDSVYKGNADGIGDYVEASLYKDGAWTTI